MADQNITALPVATTPESSDRILLVGATEEKLINYDELADAILRKIASKNFTLDQGNKTLLAALNELNSKTSKTTFNGNISRVTFRSGAAEINNVYLDFWTNDGKRTTLGFYSDSSSIQLSKDDVVIWTINGK